MRWYYKLPLRLQSIFDKDHVELDLSEELQFHLQNQIDEYVAQGVNPTPLTSDCRSVVTPGYWASPALWPAHKARNSLRPACCASTARFRMRARCINFAATLKQEVLRKVLRDELDRPNMHLRAANRDQKSAPSNWLTVGVHFTGEINATIALRG
jgi:hypothetical protein